MHAYDLSRRGFIKLTMAGLGGAALAAALPAWAIAQEDDPTDINFVADPDNPTELEKQHLINIRLPLIAEDGANVPVVISMENHPMEPDHYIRSMRMFNFNDPIVSKGLYVFTPLLGMAYLATQLRMDGGDTRLFVVCECTQHGRWAAAETLKVSLGGC